MKTITKKKVSGYFIKPPKRDKCDICGKVDRDVTYGEKTVCSRTKCREKYWGGKNTVC